MPAPLAAVRQGRRYDLIDIAGDFLDAAEANATAFSVEALAADLAALTPDGLVSIPVSIRDFPTYADRMLATARAALLAAGVADPAAHVVAYRSAWNVRILLSRAPWDAARIAAVRTLLRRPLVRRVVVSRHRRRRPRAPSSTTTCRRSPSPRARPIDRPGRLRSPTRPPRCWPANASPSRQAFDLRADHAGPAVLLRHPAAGPAWHAAAPAGDPAAGGDRRRW